MTRISLAPRLCGLLFGLALAGGVAWGADATKPAAVKPAPAAAAPVPPPAPATPPAPQATDPAAADKPVLPIPRFVSLKHGDINLRVGPGTRYPVAWVLKRRDLPVEIVAEFETFRKIRDPEGTEGWVNQMAVSGRRTLMIRGATASLHSAPAGDAAVVAQAEAGAIGRLLECPPSTLDWCRVEFGDLRGWLQRAAVWGVYPREIYPAP